MPINPFAQLAEQIRARAPGAGGFTVSPTAPVEVQAGQGTFPGHAPYTTSRIASMPRVNLGGMNLGACRCVK